VIAARDIFQAFMAFETLETAAQLQINALRLGTPRPLSLALVRGTTPLSVAEYPETDAFEHTSEEKALRRDLVKFIHRSYEQGLFTSTQGTYSARLSDGGFVITPSGKDRMYLDVDDLVLVRDGRTERGKQASRATHLHEEIYGQHPDIESILVAQPPHLMAFAVTDAPFDARTIPESYILLRDVQKIPYGATLADPAATARHLSSRTPVLVCENECVIVTGTSLLDAFDRLEVAEFSAKSIIGSAGLGPIVHIGGADVEDIRVAFGL
jgi:L-fuculose-phosphate aldolase